jgi:hypothetical protein
MSGVELRGDSMTPTNGTLDGLIEEMERLLVQAEAELYLRRQAADAAYEEVKRLRAILRAAGAAPEPEEKPAKKKVKSVRVNEETRGRVLRAIRNWNAGGFAVIPDVPHSFTAGKIAELASDVHSSSVRTAINNLRDEGLIRAVGLVPDSPRKAPMAYAMTPVPEEDPPRVG